MADAFHNPALGEHLHADDAADSLAGHTCLTNGAYNLAQRGFDPFVGIEYASINLDGVPFLSVFIIRVAQEFIFLDEMFEQPGGTRRTVSHAKQHGAGHGSGKFKCLSPFLIVPAPGGVDAGNCAFACAQVFLFRLGNALENFAPFQKLRFVTLTRFLFAIGVVRLVVDYEDIAPVSEDPLNYSVWVLLGASSHGTQDSGGNKAALFNDLFTNPVIALGLKRNGLPVLDHKIRLEFLKVFRRDRGEF